MKSSVYLILFVLVISSCSEKTKSKPQQQKIISETENSKVPLAFLKTSVISQSNSKRIDGDWGFIQLYTENQSSEESKNITTGTATVLSGKEIHPPHKQEEEEFLYIISGQGTWTIKDRIFKASSGDLLYARPQDLHGIKNTGDDDLTFYFVKWKSSKL